MSIFEIFIHVILFFILTYLFQDVDRLTAELEHMAKQQAAAEEQFMNQQRDIQLVKADVKNIDEKVRMQQILLLSEYLLLSLKS